MFPLGLRIITREPGHGHQHSRGHHQLTGRCHDGNRMSWSIARMAPLWRWSEDVQPRSGKDEAKFSVKVLDRPSAPEAPMKTTMEGSNCTLLWKKVKDDGGVAIEHYQVNYLEKLK